MSDSAKTNEKKPVETKLTVSYGLKPLSWSQKIVEFLRFLLVFGLALGLTVVILLIPFYVVQLFPEFMTVQTENGLLNTLIQVNGVLLGFVGIMFAQLLSSIMNQQNTLYQNILEEPEKASHKTKYLIYLARRKLSLSITASATFVALVLSILSSMVIIGRISKFLPTDTYSSFGTLFAPLLSAIMAIALLVLSLTGLPMKSPLEKIQNE